MKREQEQFIASQPTRYERAEVMFIHIRALRRRGQKGTPEYNNLVNQLSRIGGARKFGLGVRPRRFA